MKFQAVVMAGGLGNRMSPLVGKDLPKCTLPIANKPMIRNVLKYLDHSGVKDILVITKDSFLNQIKPQLAGFSGVEIATFEEDCGTADALRRFKDKIKSDFIVISADLTTDAPLNEIIELHIINNSSCTALLFETPKTEDIKKKNDLSAQQYFAVSGNRLAFMIEAADVEDDLHFHNNLFRKFTNISFSSSLQSAHLFIFKKWIIDLLVEKTHISSVQGELVPYLVKCQSRTTGKYDVSSFFSGQTEYVEQFRSTLGNGKDGINCVYYTWNSGICIRANNVANYIEANKQILKTTTPLFAIQEKIHPSVHADSRNMGDSIVGEGTKVEEKTSIKKSIVGKNCVIGKNIRINNSIIMDGVTIADDCKLENVVICNNAKVLENCTLKDCEVEAGYKVEKGTNEKNQKLAENKYLDD